MDSMANVIRIGFVPFSTFFVPNSDNFWLIILLPELFQENSKAVSIDGYEDVPASNEKALQKAVAHQPVSVAIEASGRAFQFYTSVHDLCFCFFYLKKKKVYPYNLDFIIIIFIIT